MSPFVSADLFIYGRLSDALHCILIHFWVEESHRAVEGGMGGATYYKGLPGTETFYMFFTLFMQFLIFSLWKQRMNLFNLECLISASSFMRGSMRNDERIIHLLLNIVLLCVVCCMFYVYFMIFFSSFFHLFFEIWIWIFDKFKPHVFLVKIIIIIIIILLYVLLYGLLLLLLLFKLKINNYKIMLNIMVNKIEQQNY